MAVSRSLTAEPCDECRDLGCMLPSSPAGCSCDCHENAEAEAAARAMGLSLVREPVDSGGDTRPALRRES